MAFLFSPVPFFQFISGYLFRNTLSIEKFKNENSISVSGSHYTPSRVHFPVSILDEKVSVLE